MRRKISSDITGIFQIAIIIKFITISAIFFVTLFISDFETNLIFTFIWIIGLLILRQIGITKLKTVFWLENSISIDNINSIPLSNVKNIKRTLIFDGFPYKVSYIESGINKELYFLPKVKFFHDFLGENETITELKKEIKKSNANNVYN